MTPAMPTSLPVADVTVLCGGVGAARFLRGLVVVMPPRRITAIVNTADDTVINGLAISPDLDTVTYTLAGAIDTERGWGLDGETWQAMRSLDRYHAVRPERSTAATTWFNLGDRDLATHLYRTQRLAEGATLTAVTAEITRAWDVRVQLLPGTDDTMATVVTTTDGRELSFQEYFVRHHHDIEIAGLVFGPPGARLTASAQAALSGADVVVIAPSNPLVSIGPLRHLPGLDDTLADRRDSVVAVSPIVGGAALKGPADRMLSELGHEPSVVGVARLYADIASVLVIDPVDAHLAPAVEAAGMRPVVTPSVMTTPQIAATLATTTITSVAP